MNVNRELTKAMLQHYGWKNKKMVVVEELSELTKEVCKQERGLGNIHDLVEEMADVYIVLDMIKEHYKITDVLIDAMIDAKESRNRRRLAERLVEADD